MAAVITLSKFKGLSTSTTYAQMGEGECPVFENLRLFEEGRKVVQRRGQAPVFAFGPDTHADMQGLFWHKLGSTEYLLGVVSGSVVDAYTGAVVPGGQNRFPGGNEVNACWLDFQVIMGDGVHPNCTAWVANGALVVTQLTVDPASGGATTFSAGAAGLPNGTYSYAIKFVSARGIESDIQSYTGAVTVALTQIRLANLIQPPAGQDCQFKNLYRTKDGGSTYFLVAQLAAAASTYTDTAADSGLGLPMLNQGYQNSPLPPCRYLLAHQNRLYGAGCFATTGAVTGSVNVVYVSDVLDPTTARLATDPSTTYQGGRFPLETPAAGTLSGLGAYGSMVCCFTGGSMFLLTGDRPLNFTLSNFSTHGCTSHRSILSAQEALLWLAPDGVYAWKAQGYLEYTLTQRSYVRISDRIRDRIDAMSASDMSQASAVFSDNRYWLSTPSTNLVYDLLYDAWYEDTGNNWRQLAVSLYSPSNRPRLYGSLLGHSTVYQLDVGTLDGTGAIHCHLQTKDLDAELPAHNKRAAWVGGLFRAASETLSGSLIRNAGQTIHAWLIPLVSGSTWQVVPANANVVRMRQRVPDNALSEWFRLDFACDSRSGNFEILQGTLELLEQNGSPDAGGVNG